MANFISKSTSEPDTLLPLTSDLVFKHVLGQEESKPILMAFLNAMLNLNIQSPDQLILQNPNFSPKYENDKLSILDIRVRLQDRTSIDIEIQIVNEHNIEPRALYYTCCLCTEQLKKGEDYILLRPSIGLNLLSFDLYNDSSYYRSFILKDRITNMDYPHLFEIAFLELSKGMHLISEQKGSVLSKKDQWILFLTANNKEVQKKMAESNATFRAAYDRLVSASSDEELRIQYFNREKALRDWNSSIHEAERRGKKQGEKQGEERGKRIGENHFALLTEKLLADERYDDLRQAANDPDRRTALYQEYGI